jgi:flagellar basal-body rod protein FlgG
MLSRLTDLDVVSHNLSNVNTAGFKRNRANFQELLAAAGDHSGVRLVSTQTMTEQGHLRNSTRALDLAIQGEGYFAVQMPDDTIAYTRDGQLVLDENGQLVTPEGYPLVIQGQIPQGTTAVEIHTDGGVYAQQGTTWTQVGTLKLNRFANPAGMTSAGDNLWLATEVSGEAQAGAPGSEGMGTIVPFAIEQSNVNLADEMTHMVTLQRAFQMSVRTFQQTDEMISEAIRMRKA